MLSGRYCANFNSALTLITLRNCQILGPDKNEWHFSILLWHIVIFWQNSETLIVQYKQSLRLWLSWIEPLWKNRRYSREQNHPRLEKTRCIDLLFIRSYDGDPRSEQNFQGNSEWSRQKILSNARTFGQFDVFSLETIHNF